MKRAEFARYAFCLLSLLLFSVGKLTAGGIDAACRREIARTLTRITAREVALGWVRVQSVYATRKRVRIHASVGLSYYPFREANVRALYDSVRLCLPEEYRQAEIELRTDGRRIEDLIPLAARNPEARRRAERFVQSSERPLVEPLSVRWRAASGLYGNHIALWQSHGRYFDQRENRWRWQRVPRWQTCEDLYTQSYVLPFLVPMLEQAGACVLLPRERDVQECELIADNDAPSDGRSLYAERSGREAWQTAGTGFAPVARLYRTGENPFDDGTFRAVRTVTHGDVSEAEWRLRVPRTGDYSVYVSYASLPESADDALYTVRHAGGDSRFAVNQTMGGGTWIHLGRFRFRAGDEAVVTLNNRSARGGRIVTADAVRLGGGYGNIVRSVCDSLRRDGERYAEEPSGYPRYCEGARYWLQWAGFDDAVYSPEEHTDDYLDDYRSRALWVNALMGGSSQLPDSTGLGIPIDLALAFHTDSGVREGDETVGTLGICCTHDDRGRFGGGGSRYLSRDLTDLVMTQVVQDVRRTFEPRWTRRGLWNRAYYEARVPHAPTLLLELLSHQNFADMCYGSDPRFRFTVSRAVYKAILKHVAAQYDRPCVVQPLPVREFALHLDESSDSVTLAWRPTDDPLEPTARPDGYLVYTRLGDGGFDAGRFTTGQTVTLAQPRGVLCSYRVTAVNDGGESFPSETLAACRAVDEVGRLVVVNGFDRVSGPLAERSDTLVGFRNDLDSGVPYLCDIAFAGRQRVFDPDALRAADSCALGSCGDEYGGTVGGGNSFDYPALHGLSVMRAGWSFASLSAEAVAARPESLDGYDAVDLVLGKQRSVSVGRGMRGTEFAAFPSGLRAALSRYVGRGGALFVSGCYVVSDLCASGDGGARRFAADVLHCLPDGAPARRSGRFVVVPSSAGIAPGIGTFGVSRSPERYAVETTDALLPAAGAFVWIRHADDRRAAGVAWSGAGSGRCAVAAFPFECIESALLRDRMMEEILRFLKQGKDM